METWRRQGADVMKHESEEANIVQKKDSEKTRDCEVFVVRKLLDMEL